MVADLIFFRFAQLHLYASVFHPSPFRSFRLGSVDAIAENGRNVCTSIIVSTTNSFHKDVVNSKKKLVSADCAVVQKRRNIRELLQMDWKEMCFVALVSFHSELFRTEECRCVLHCGVRWFGAGAFQSAMWCLVR